MQQTHVFNASFLVQVKEEDELGAKPKRRGKVMSDYEKWEIAQLIKSGRH